MNYRRSSLRQRVWALGWVAICLALPVGCKSEKCDADLVDRAVELMKDHQSCTVDADCVTVGDYCRTLPGGFCGQLVMNKEGRNSAEWADLSKELESCAPDPEDCATCLAIRGVGCSNGSCNGP